jgi:hypothetical protein
VHDKVAAAAAAANGQEALHVPGLKVFHVVTAGDTPQQQQQQQQRQRKV